jgi:hypothetical protein
MIAQKISIGAKFAGFLIVITCWLALHFYNFDTKTLMYLGIALIFVGILAEPHEHQE